MTEHPITPPPELVQQWFAAWESNDNEEMSFAEFAIPSAAQWGADQELEACLRLVEIDAGEDAYDFARYIRAARRPKPPSLKEQALRQLDHLHERAFKRNFAGFQTETIRRALEALPDD